MEAGSLQWKVVWLVSRPRMVCDWSVYEFVNVEWQAGFVNGRQFWVVVEQFN